MSDVITCDVFAEDRAHEAFVPPLLKRLAGDEGKRLDIHVRSARGGHGRALQELGAYQRAAGKAQERLPDILVIAIDGNCKGQTEARKDIASAVQASFEDRSVLACPDPHIEHGLRNRRPVQVRLLPRRGHRAPLRSGPRSRRTRQRCASRRAPRHPE